MVDTQTVLSTTILPTTCYVEVTDYVYVNTTVTQNFTENLTKTLHHTVKLTDTEYETETETEHETETETDTVEITETDSVTITTTDTVPATITTYTTETETLLSTEYDPCPKSCSMYVNQFRLKTICMLTWLQRRCDCHSLLLANRPASYLPRHLC